MRNINLVPVILLLLICSFTAAQVVQSEKSYLRVNNIPKKEVVRVVDLTPPEIRIISPEPDTAGNFTSPTSDFNLIGKVSDESGVSSLILNGELKGLSPTGIFAGRILLVPGWNEIKIAAMDTNDNLSERILTVQYNPPELSLHDKVEKEAAYYALIIGIQNYQDPSIANLDNPIRDAQSLYDILINRYTFDKAKILFLKDPKREDIINALDELADKVTANDNLLIFYAGHGWWDEQADIGYWLPADARKNSKVAWFSNSTLVDYLKQVKSKHTLLIADACFTGTIFKTRSAFPDADKAIQKLYELPSRKAMTSGTLTEVPDRSSFMKYLCEELKDNRLEYLSSEQLFSSIRIAVINNSDAVPQYGEIRNVGDQGGDFIFIRK
jgi:hypothetical protein